MYILKNSYVLVLGLLLVSFSSISPVLSPGSVSAQQFGVGAGGGGGTGGVPGLVTVNPPLIGDGAPASPVTCPIANTSQAGCISSQSWNVFNSKGGGDVVSIATSAVDGEVAVFSSSSGKAIRRATFSGLLNSVNGIAFGITAPVGDVVGTIDSQVLSNKKLGSLITNGFVKTNNSDGSLSVDTNSYQIAGSYQNLLTNSAGLRAALSDENGTGVALFNGAINAGLTTPWIATGIKDVNGATILNFTPVASAVNYLVVKNAIAGVSPGLAVDGACADCDLYLIPKGNGAVSIGANGTASTPILVFQSDTAGWYRNFANQWTFTSTGNNSMFSFLPPGYLRAASDAIFGWGSGTSETAMDTAIRRKVVGVVEIDSSALIVSNLNNARHILAGRYQLAEMTAPQMPTAADLSIAGGNVQDTAHLIVANDKACFAFQRSGTVTYVCAPLNSTVGAVAWTNSTSPP